MLERGKTLEENLRQLEEERQRSEQLLHRMMPKAVADRLRDGQKAIDTCEVHSVVLFPCLGAEFDRWNRSQNKEVTCIY